MSYFCFKCLNELDIASGKVGFRDECSKCKSDLHVCKNCVFYDTSAYNECREPQAERVLEKERPNYCDYFTFRSSSTKPVKSSSSNDHLKKLDDIFK